MIPKVLEMYWRTRWQMSCGANDRIFAANGYRPKKHRTKFTKFVWYKHIEKVAELKNLKIFLFVEALICCHQYKSKCHFEHAFIM
jgi:hypothetical protein